jgi:NAD(P)H-flavin reductase
LFLFEDEQWPFQRIYSIVDYDTDNEKTMLIFAIKLSDQGRWSTLVRKTQIGSEVTIKGVFGNFILQNTQLPKVFIWTWAGIVPLINMAKYCMTEKQLLFSVSNKKDLFYEDRIKKIHGLWHDIYITQENIPGYHYGRIDFAKRHFDSNTEFYLCWKPEIVDDIIKNLTLLWYKRMYIEKF